MVNSVLIVCVAVSIVHLCIGTSIFLKAPRERTNQAFYLSIISVVVWMLLTTNSAIDQPQLEIRETLTRFAYATGMLTSAAIAVFFVIFSNEGKVPRKDLTSITAVAVVFILLSFYPGAILKGFVRNETGVSEINGPLRIPFYAAIAAIFVFAFTRVRRRYITTDFDNEKRQLRLLGIGIFTPAAASIVSLAILPFFIEPSPLQMSIGPISTVVLIILAGYATVKQGHFIEVDLAPDHVFESISAGVCVARVDGKILRHNSMLVDMLDYHGKLNGRSLDYLADFLGPNMEERITFLKTWLREEKPNPIEMTLSGLRNKSLELSASPLKDGGGKTVGKVILFQDITERRFLKEEIRSSEEKYRTLVEESENIVFILQNGCLKFVNRHGRETSEYSERELCNADFDLSTLIHPDDRAQVANAFSAISSHKADHIRLEARFISKGRKVYDCIMTATALDFSGRPAIMGVMVDITEKKKLQRQLVQSEKLASIGQLVSGVAHELNNPLAAIMGYSQLLSETEGMASKDREAARKVFESSVRCKKIIQNLLSFAKKQKIEKIGLDINEILDKAIELRAYELESHNIEVFREYTIGLKPVAADPQHLQSVFLNIINNACDAMYESAGKGILQIATKMDGDKIVVDIIDNGPGIPPEIQDKVFDPFFTSKQVGHGTGLGLSISYGIIHEHGGELILDTAYTGGTRFTIKLPAGESRMEKSPQAGFSLPEEGRLQKPKVLVVDDEETILELSIDILDSKGYDVDTAPNGEVARAMIEANSYDLVIADIRMPGALSGIDLFYWVKQNVPGFENRIVFATGDLVAEETQKFLSETKRPCLSKPFEMSEYLDTVRNAIAASQSAN